MSNQGSGCNQAANGMIGCGCLLTLMTFLAVGLLTMAL